MIGTRRVECPFCERPIAVTERETLRCHNVDGTRTLCKGSGADVSDRIARQDEDDRDDWSSWLAK